MRALSVRIRRPEPRVLPRAPLHLRGGGRAGDRQGTQQVRQGRDQTQHPMTTSGGPPGPPIEEYPMKSATRSTIDKDEFLRRIDRAWGLHPGPGCLAFEADDRYV